MAGSRALHEGDDVLAGADSVAELHHFDGSSTRLDAEADAVLERIADPDGRPHLVLRLGTGNSFHRTASGPSRGGQYEARTPAGVALARRAVFTVACDDEGAARFLALSGTVVVRGNSGGTVVLRAGECVAVAPDGTVGDVEQADPADDEWVAVNAALDADEAAAAPPAPQPAPSPALVAEPVPAPVTGGADGDPYDFAPEPDDHPWKVGVAATVAIGIGIFSVVIGRAGSATPVTEHDPAVAVPGPPAFSTPAFTAPTPPIEAPPATPPEVAAPPTTAATAPRAAGADAAFDVAGRTCSRGGTDVITFTGSLRNRSSQPHTYTVRVRIIGPRDATITTVTTTVSVPGATTRTFRVSTPPLRNARAATACDANRVTVVS